MVLKKNKFVTLLLPNAILRKLTPEEMAVYVEPFQDEESRRPTLTFPREIPIVEEGPADVVGFVTDYFNWLKQSDTIPKLHVRAEPGFFGEYNEMAAKLFPNTRSVTVKGHHFLQEDSPDEIGVAVRDFIQTL